MADFLQKLTNFAPKVAPMPKGSKASGLEALGGNGSEKGLEESEKGLEEEGGNVEEGAENALVGVGKDEEAADPKPEEPKLPNGSNAAYKIKTKNMYKNKNK